MGTLGASGEGLTPDAHPVLPHTPFSHHHSRRLPLPRTILWGDVSEPQECQPGSETASLRRRHIPGFMQSLTHTWSGPLGARRACENGDPETHMHSHNHTSLQTQPTLTLTPTHWPAKAKSTADRTSLYSLTEQGWGQGGSFSGCVRRCRV